MTNIKPLYLLPPIIFFILAIIMFIGLGRENPNELPSQMVGRSAPNLTISPLSELPFFDETDLKASNIKIVNFWASWCAPCRVEHPNIQQLSDLGFVVHGINYKDTKKNANNFLKELGNPYDKIIFDNKGTNSIEWGAYGVPESFLINKNKIIKKYIGPLSEESMKEIKLFIK